MIPGSFEVSTTALLVQAVVALLSPAVVAVIPIFAGARVTVQEAINTYGLRGAVGLLDRLLVRFEFIPRLVLLTISNTFRNKGRVFLTEITLVGAGVIFLMVMNTRLSLTYTFSNVIFSIFDANVMIELQEAERIKEIEALTLSQPGVEAVEVWGLAKGTARLQGQPESNDDSKINLRGLPINAKTYVPQMRAGRWLMTGDAYSIVLNHKLAEEMGVGVGDWITIDIPTKGESNWRVVGLVFEPLDQESALVPRETLLREIRQVGRGKSIRVQTVHGDAAAEAAVANALRTLYEEQSYEVVVSLQDTSHNMIKQQLERMSIMISLLGAMAALISMVGAVSLSGTLSINVTERTREIGVMRAIGASSMVVGSQFIGEGLILGWLSWLFAIPLSVPAGWLLVKGLSGLVNINLVYQYSEIGVLVWFVVITILTVIASWFPAQKAAQTCVRESLAYV
jgi:putative ABC transport system permease protein